MFNEDNIPDDLVTDVLADLPAPEEEEIDVHAIQDDFLDAYATYLHNGTPMNKRLVSIKAEAWQLVDPSFTFEIKI